MYLLYCKAQTDEPQWCWSYIAYKPVSQPLDTDYLRTSINLRGLKTDYDYENNTNTSFSKFGLSPTCTNFTENLVSFVSQLCRNKGLWSPVRTWHRLLVKGSSMLDLIYQNGPCTLKLLCWKTASQRYVVGRAKTFCCLPTQIREFGSIDW